MPTIEVLLDVVKLLGLTSLVPIAFTLINNSRRDRDQARRQNFASYAKRYAEVTSALAGETAFSEPFDPTNERHRQLVTEFFMLLSEEEY